MMRWVAPKDVPLRRRGRRGRYVSIVVGSGIGGCVASALLARAGDRVLVLDKNEVPGGVLAAFERDGFKFDAGGHLIACGERGTVGRALRAAGADKSVRFLRHEIPVRSRGMLELTAPSRRLGLPLAGRRAADAVGLPLRERLHVLRLLFHLMTLTEIELRRWDRRSLEELLLRYTKHPGAYFLFSFLASIFFALPPGRVAAGAALRGLRGLLRAYSLSYVRGGMDSIVSALLGRVTSVGGEVVVGSKVVAIERETRNGLLRVTCDDGRSYDAPQVVCNLAPRDTLALLGPRIERQPRWVDHIESLRPSGNAHQIKLALRRPLLDEGCMIAGVSLSGQTLADLSLATMRKAVQDVDAGRLCDPLAIYAPVPTNFDASIAPTGRQIISASVYAPTCADPVDGPERWQEALLSSLERTIPGLRDELMFCEMTAVPAIGAWIGSSGCGAISNGQVPGQVGRDRLPVTTPVRGLFLCGDGAGGRGIGVEMAAASGMQAANAMLDARAGNGRSWRERHQQMLGV